MLPQPDIYCCPKTSEVWDAIVAGTKGTRKWAPEDDYDPSRPAFIGGLDFGSDRLLAQALRSAQAPFFFVDRAYFGGGRGSGKFRVIMNAYHQIPVQAVDSEKMFGIKYESRFEALGIDIRPWRREPGANIYVCPSSKKHHWFFQCQDWADTITDRLKMVTNKRIVRRSKGDGPPFYALMKHGDPHAVVTYASNAAVEAACLGIPVYSPAGAAAYVGFSNLRLVDTPFGDPNDDKQHGKIVRSDADRLGWARALAWHDFTVEEMANGFMWKVLNARI